MSKGDKLKRQVEEQSGACLRLAQSLDTWHDTGRHLRDEHRTVIHSSARQAEVIAHALTKAVADNDNDLLQRLWKWGGTATAATALALIGGIAGGAAEGTTGAIFDEPAPTPVVECLISVSEGFAEPLTRPLASFVEGVQYDNSFSDVELRSWERVVQSRLVAAGYDVASVKVGPRQVTHGFVSLDPDPYAAADAVFVNPDRYAAADAGIVKADPDPDPDADLTDNAYAYEVEVLLAGESPIRPGSELLEPPRGIYPPTY